jgi:hypothetical protein
MPAFGLRRSLQVLASGGLGSCRDMRFKAKYREELPQF